MHAIHFIRQWLVILKYVVKQWQLLTIMVSNVSWRSLNSTLVFELLVATTFLRLLVSKNSIAMEKVQFWLKL